MNINYQFNKDDKSVTVSSEKGKIKKREYQDNIEEVLGLENIIEDLESELFLANRRKSLSEKKLVKLIEETAKGKKEAKKYAIAGSVMFPTAFIIVFFAVPFVYSGRGLTFLVKLLYAFLSCVPSFIYLIFTPKMMWPSTKKKSKARKKELEEEISEEEIKISALELLLSQNYQKLQELQDNERTTNINTMTSEIKEVSYHEQLEEQKAILEQMVKEITTSLSNTEVIETEVLKRKLNI